jgi:hypothetical protein
MRCCWFVFICVFVAWLVCVYIVLAELRTGSGRTRKRNRGGAHVRGQQAQGVDHATASAEQQHALTMRLLASQNEQHLASMTAACLHINNYDCLVLLVCVVCWCV